MPNKNFGIFCHDNFDELPDLSTVQFEGLILPKTMVDCRPVSPSGKLKFIGKKVKVQCGIESEEYAIFEKAKFCLSEVKKLT